jgi:hypothetical protein
MSTETLTAPDELADRNQRSHGPLADELLAERPGRPRATARVIVAFNGSPAAKDALRLGDLLALSAGSESDLGCQVGADLQGFREIRSGSARLYLLISVPVSGLGFGPPARSVTHGQHRLTRSWNPDPAIGGGG